MKLELIYRNEDKANTVDDDPVVNFVHQRMVQKYILAKEPAVFEDGRTGLDYLYAHEDDYERFLVLLDINMPEMNGWEFLDELKDKEQLAEKLDIFILTSSVANKDAVRAGEYALVKDYITKPLNEQACEVIKSQVSAL